MHVLPKREPAALSGDRMRMIWKLISLLQLLRNRAAGFGDLFGTGMG
jgi:hypothetical protein